MVNQFEYKSEFNEIKVTTGLVAKQANGECLVQSGDTVVLVTAVGAKEAKEGQDFFPLTCDYEEKMYASGKFPGGYIKREGKASDEATLIARQIDRPIRPLFPEGFKNEVQIIATVLSYDEDHLPDILAMIGSSISLSISDIPFDGPTGSVSVGYIDGEFIINPNKEQRKISELDLTVSGTKDAIMMVEAGANELSEDTMLEAILFAHEEIKEICSFIETIVEQIGKEKFEFEVHTPREDLVKEVNEFSGSQLKEALIDKEKQSRDENMDRIKEETRTYFEEKYPEMEEQDKRDIETIMDEIVHTEFRRLITEEGIRPDRRDRKEIRPLSAAVDILPRTHGDGLFTRGQTQVLSIATLGTSYDAQTIDGLGEEFQKTYYHQYNFPPFSVGETGRMRGPGRREIGHGRLAERALVPVIPSQEEFPYTIRVVSEVLESNGSSSMASVCGSTLSLMDAGVPIKKPVAGIAMGLIKEGENLTILTDIQGLEDHLGDMDFKVAGTKDGINALQMDIKISGISREVLAEALQDAKEARLKILDVITDCIKEPRKEMSEYAPRIIKMNVAPEKIGDIIGQGGKTINEIIAKTDVRIETEDNGQVTIAASDNKSGQKAKEMIDLIVKEVEVGDVYLGKITKIMNYGAFVELKKGTEGLCHISEMQHSRTNKVEDLFKEGDEIMVKVIDIDSRGKISLSRKALLPKEDKKNN